ncbi:hypothetical protein OS493_009814 [Desmophyllum pertusum]|uniref:Phospholipid/glycerol acyltransferase domain-containing protein n=1 Tax=Desmophyllum pertusum TaxID=174260 RepID=A0A9X0CLD6_9CNID|nr:hypothetical protein OS493_009814 [Desmophyllum pertusum]
MVLPSSVKRFPLMWLWIAIVFLASGMIINCVQLLLLPLWIINKDLFRWLNLNVVYLHWCQLTFLAEWWSGMEIKLYGTKEDFDKLGKERAICLCNHRSDVDWLIGYTLADRAGVLATCKCYMKGYLKFMPIIGFSWWCTEFVFLRRNWQKDQKVLDKSLSTLKDFPHPFWMVIFAEGTRLTEAKLQASVEYARSNGLPELKHHLLPRSRGFSMTVQYFKDKVPAVYDMEVAFPKHKEPNLTRMLMGEGNEVHLWLRRTPLQDIPCDNIEETSNWCKKAFQEKDKGMSYFFEHGRFPADRMEYPRKSKNLIVVLFWNAILGLPLVWYFIPVILSGSTASLLTAAALALVGYTMIKVLLHFSDSKKGSSFGLKPSNGVTKSVPPDSSPAKKQP